MQRNVPEQALYWIFATRSLPPHTLRNKTVPCSLYYFPISAVKRKKKLPQMWCLKQYKFITLQFYSSRVQHRSPQTEVKVPAGLHPSLEVLEQDLLPFLSSFWRPPATLGSRHLFAIVGGPSPSHWFSVARKVSASKASWDHIGSHWNAGSSAHFKVLNHICEDPFAM